MIVTAAREPSSSAADAEPKDIAELCQRWRVARLVAPPLPPFEELLLNGLGRIDDNVVLLSGDPADWTIKRVGRAVGARFKCLARDAALSQVDADLAWAFSDAARAALEQGAPHRAEAYFARHGEAQSCILLALPLANRWGPPLVAVCVVERGPRHSLIDAMFAASDEGVIALAAIRDARGRPSDFQIVDLNDSAARLLGCDADRLRWRRLGESDHPFSAPTVVRRLRALLGGDGRRYAFELTTRLNGEPAYLRVGLARTGNLVCATLTNVTKLRQREESNRLLFDFNPMPMWIVDAETRRFLAVNDSAVAHYGYPRERFLGMTADDLLHPAERRAEAADGDDAGDSGDRSRRHARADGSEIEVLSFSRDIEYHGRAGQLAAIVDITQRKRAEAEVAYLARHDALTGLSNRADLRDNLAAAIEASRREGRRLAVCCVDLDLFKDVNDTFGHPTGDRLLRVVAQRLRGALSQNDLTARQGGDEFTVVLDNVGSPEDVDKTVARLNEMISRPYWIDGLEIVIGASIGVALFPDDGLSADELVKNADLALYQAKSEGRRRHNFFREDLHRAAQQRRAIEADLRAALAEGQLEVHYQPLVEISGNRVSGFEALLRWRHPTRGMIAPGEFIPIAEATGLIAPIGEWVLRTACADAASWPAPMSVAVNLSATQFRGANLVNAVVSALAHSGLAAERLELEITETVLLAQTAATIETLHALRAFGVRIALDDFGTGYSSLSYLRSFPFDKIKIDRSFVQDLAERPDCTAIVVAISNLARSLGMATTAEGVETREQLRFLRSQGCTEAQGFLFSPAAPRDDLAAIVGRIQGRTTAEAA
jgi:diguanylate cyclase (GGDEF)-like protein/PAS domain S-box-containing protein